MTYNPEKQQRRSIRLRNYDYSQPGNYYITICTQNRECFFGLAEDGDVKLNDVGVMVKKWWLELKNKYKNINLDEFIIMPNHVHGILILKNKFDVGANLRVRPYNNLDEESNKGQTHRGCLFNHFTYPKFTHIIMLNTGNTEGFL